MPFLGKRKTWPKQATQCRPSHSSACIGGVSVVLWLLWSWLTVLTVSYLDVEWDADEHVPTYGDDDSHKISLWGNKQGKPIRQVTKPNIAAPKHSVCQAFPYCSSVWTLWDLYLPSDCRHWCIVNILSLCLPIMKLKRIKLKRITMHIYSENQYNWAE